LNSSTYANQQQQLGGSLKGKGGKLEKSLMASKIISRAAAKASGGKVNRRIGRKRTCGFPNSGGIGNNPRRENQTERRRGGIRFCHEKAKHRKNKEGTS